MFTRKVKNMLNSDSQHQYCGTYGGYSVHWGIPSMHAGG